MRLLVYNIAYGTGSPGREYKRLFTSHRYLRTDQKYFQQIREFIGGQQPDVIGLIEVDSGSFRTGKVNQVQELADELGHYHVCQSKYGNNSFANRVPLLRNQVNAVLTSTENAVTSYHYFPCGVKKLVIEIEIEEITFFFVHLSLRKSTRAEQLEYLSGLIPRGRPVIIAGDFNCFSGTEELRHICGDHGLINANMKNSPTYPAWEPVRQLDFILHSPQIVPDRFEIMPVELSDHLPLLMDFHV